MVSNPQEWALMHHRVTSRNLRVMQATGTLSTHVKALGRCSLQCTCGSAGKRQGEGSVGVRVLW
jgi:hypothetical protein